MSGVNNGGSDWPSAILVFGGLLLTALVLLQASGLIGALTKSIIFLPAQVTANNTVSAVTAAAAGAAAAAVYSVLTRVNHSLENVESQEENELEIYPPKASRYLRFYANTRVEQKNRLYYDGNSEEAEETNGDDQK